jgi:hypothetical protein
MLIFDLAVRRRATSVPERRGGCTVVDRFAALGLEAPAPCQWWAKWFITTCGVQRVAADRLDGAACWTAPQFQSKQAGVRRTRRCTQEMGCFVQNSRVEGLGSRAILRKRTAREQGVFTRVLRPSECTIAIVIVEFQ